VVIIFSLHHWHGELIERRELFEGINRENTVYIRFGISCDDSKAIFDIWVQSLLISINNFRKQYKIEM